MKVRNFKKYDVILSTPTVKAQYKDYKEDLEKDFSCRCAYCDLYKGNITTPFEVDHFIPKKEFSGKRDELMTDYNNLVYSCKKCNQTKGSKFSGNILSENATNELFYDPRKVNYNDIFYRNEFGAIASDDTKGREIINLLKLYRPIHTLAWICDELRQIENDLSVEIARETNQERKELLRLAREKIIEKYYKLNAVFISSYNEPDFSISDV